MLTLLVPSKESLERLEVKDSTNLATSKSSVRFVSEDECRCDGKFRDRMEEIGVTIKTGISMVEMRYNSNSAHSVKESARSHSNVILKTKNTKRVNTNRMHNAVTPRDSRDILDLQESAIWEPLTMEALVQNKKGLYADEL